MSKIKIENYYAGLSGKQKEKLAEKASVYCYYSYYDELEKYQISNENAGILFRALTFYGKTHGQEELPIELSEPIEKEPLLCYIFETWCQREKNATLNWVNHRGGTPKAPKTKTTPPPAEPTIEDMVIEETPFGKIELSGIKKNMPSSNDDFRAIASVVGDEFNNFIGYGNVVEWYKPFKDIVTEYVEEFMEE